MRGEGDIRQAAHRRAAVRRSDLEAMSLYGSNIRATPKLSAHGSQIAVPGGGPLRRGGLRPLFRAGRKGVKRCAIMQRRSARRSWGRLE